MKKFFFVMFLYFCLCPSFSNAGGTITHMFIAEEVISKLQDAQLRNILYDNFDAYLVGAVYPDSGFMTIGGYGEDSHWNPFIYTFADYIKQKYPDPAIQNPKLVAFLFGCAVHSVSDIVIHWTFYPVMAKKDFNSDDWEVAHQYGDTGIDLILNIDKNRWFSQPKTWWVPVKDLVAVYHLMGKDQYNESEIIWGNSVLSLLGTGERMLSAPAYPYLEWKIAWTAKHYYDWPVGGFLMDEQSVTFYLTNLWQRLQGQPVQPVIMSMTATPKKYRETINSPLNSLAQQALLSNVVSVEVKKNDDGSVELGTPVINEAEKFDALLKDFLKKF